MRSLRLILADGPSTACCSPYGVARPPLFFRPAYKQSINSGTLQILIIKGVETTRQKVTIGPSIPLSASNVSLIIAVRNKGRKAQVRGQKNDVSGLSGAVSGTFQMTGPLFP